jgi:hypothetical protein
MRFSFDRHRKEPVMRKKTVVVLGLMMVLPLLSNAQRSPDEFFNTTIGADRTLIAYPQIREYFAHLASVSPRVRISDEGVSTLGNPMLLAVISSEKNLNELARLVEINRKLANPDRIDPQELPGLIASGKVFVLITAAIHATEIAATQMAMLFAHDWATTGDPAKKSVLDRVVILLMPSINPDGNIMVTEWYKKSLGTTYEGGRMPWLYHHYAGHDTNRDFCWLNLVETRVVNAVLHHRYLPHIFLDMHQMGSSGPRMFVPPFHDPINPNLDPLLMRQTDLIGAFMSLKLQSNHKRGVASGYAFDAYWPGGSKNTAWYKNVVGILTEMASVATATPLYVEANELSVGAKGLPEYKAQVNFPDPWRGGWWHLRDIIEYERIAVEALIEVAAQNRETFLTNFHALGEKNIRLGKNSAPSAYVFPTDQWDPSALFTFMGKMKEHGLRVFRLNRDVTENGSVHSAGSFVLPMSQPYRGFIQAVMERQQYPRIRYMRQGPIIEPYDVSGWTMPLLMGVTCRPIAAPFEGTVLTPIEKIDLPEPTISGQGRFIAFSGRANRSFILLNRLLKAKIPVYRLSRPSTTPVLRTGAFLIDGKGLPEDELLPMLKETGLELNRLDPASTDALIRMRAPRIAIYQSYLSNMDEGWTRWLLDQFEFPFTVLHNGDLKKDDWQRKIDVLLFADQDRSAIVDGTYTGYWARYASTLPPRYKGGIGAEGLENIREFVKGGGTVVLLDSASALAIQDFKLPLTNVLEKKTRDDFFCPGSILRVKVNNADPIAWGMPREAVLFFSHSPAFKTQIPLQRHIDRRAVAQFSATESHLLSGYLKGGEHLNRTVAAARFRYHGGKVIVLGGRVQFRGQTPATFKLLFNSLLFSRMEWK